MIGYVIFGALAGLTGGVAHLATGGSVLGALGLYAALGTLGVLGLAVRAALLPDEPSLAEGLQESARPRGRNRRVQGTRSGEAARSQVRPQAHRIAIRSAP